MTPATAANLVEALCQTPLLAAPQLEELVQHLQQQYADVRDLARELMRRDWLTPFQINHLLLGKGNDLILGNYLLVERLGEGGMGQVFKARHRTFGRMVALKVLRNNLLTNQTAVRRFLREMSTAAVLDHPNIVKALDAAQVEGTYFFAMEFVEGQDLARMVKQQGPLKIARACDYIRQAALGLQHAHEQGFVHRDIKPANLLVSNPDEHPASGTPFGRWGTVRILDMGLARIVEDEGGPAVTQLTQMGVVMGTPDFIAPEQARNSSKTDIRSDLYSLGATFYFLLAGKVPFPEGSLTEKLLQHQLDEPIPVADVRRAQQLALGMPPSEVRYLSPRVSDLVRQLMAKRPEQRFQTPAEVAEALSELLTSGAAGNVRPSERLPVVVPPASGKIRTGPTSGKQARPAPPPSSRRLRAEASSSKAAASPTPPPDSAAETTRVQEPNTTIPPVPVALPAAPWKRWLLYAGVAAGVLLLLLVALSLRGTERPPKEIPVVRSRPDAVEQDWLALRSKSGDRNYPVFELRRELIAFRLRHPTAPQSRRAGELLVQLRSPLDQLDSTWIPAAEHFDWQPQQLVGVFGQRGLDTLTSWGNSSVVISPDARYLAGCLLGGLVSVWDLATMTPRERPWLGGFKNRVTRLAFSPDGSTLAGGTVDGRILFWDSKTHDLRTAELPRPSERFFRSINAVAWAPDGQSVLVGGNDGSLHQCQVGNLEVQELEGRQPARLVQAVRFSPDGSLLACARYDDTLTIYPWPYPTKNSAPAEPMRVGRSAVLAFSPDSQTLLAAGTADGVIRVYQRNGQRFVEKNVLRGHRGVVTQLAFSPNGKRFASASADGAQQNRLLVWDAERGVKVPLWQYRQGPTRDECELRWLVSGLAWASDGRHLATANANGTIYVFRLVPEGSAPVARQNGLGPQHASR